MNVMFMVTVRTDIFSGHSQTYIFQVKKVTQDLLVEKASWTCFIYKNKIIRVLISLAVLLPLYLQ